MKCQDSQEHIMSDRRFAILLGKIQTVYYWPCQAKKKKKNTASDDPYKIGTEKKGIVHVNN